MVSRGDKIIAPIYVTVLSYIFQLCVLNIESARNKEGDSNDIISERNLDFMVLMTEFWLQPTDPDYFVHTNDFNAENYALLNHLRNNGVEWRRHCPHT